MQIKDALTALEAHIAAGRAQQMAEYHQQTRRVLGVPNGAIHDLTKAWRQQLSLTTRVTLAADLWHSDIFEARIAAAKLLTQSRIKEDGAVWDLLLSWVPEFDSGAIADHACSAIGKRLVAAPDRLDQVDAWTTSDHMWTRRAALVATLPWAKLPNPKPADAAARTRILGWAATYVPDRNRLIQKTIAGWLRDLSKHAPQLSQDFLDQHGAAMKPFARKEAAKFLTTSG